MKINGTPDLSLSPDESEVEGLAAAEMLRKSWNVNNKEELKHTLNNLIYNGVITVYRNLLKTLNTHRLLADDINAAWNPDIQKQLLAEGVFSNSDILILHLIKEYPESFDYSVFAAAELSRLSIIVQWGMEAGYLDFREGSAVLEDIALIFASQNWGFGLLAHSQMAFVISNYTNLGEYDYSIILRDMNIVVHELTESAHWGASESSHLISHGRELLKQGRELPAFAEYITTPPDFSMIESPELLRSALHCNLGLPVPGLHIYENDARLFYALKTQDADAVAHLLHTWRFWDTPVRGLLWTGHAAQHFPEMLELFINHDYRIDEQGAYLDRSSLHIAAMYNQPVAVKILLRHGADIEKQSAAGETPLSLGIANHSTEAVEILLQAKADPNSGVSNERSPLGYSLREGLIKESILLLEHGADPDLYSGWNWTNIMLAARYTDARVMQLMLEAGADPNQHAEGLSPTLHLAIIQQDYEVLSMLIAAGADLESQDGDGETALAFAIRKDEREAARILLEAGANPDARLTIQRTPLGYSLLNSLNEQALLLLDYGADPLIDQGTDWSPIVLASGYANPEVVQRLLDAGCDPNDFSMNSVPNLHLAILQGESRILSMLIAAGAELESLSPSDEMILALNRDNPEFLSKLLAAGADLESPNPYGETALAFAIRKDEHEAARILLEAGANPDARLKTQRTPLGYSLLNRLNEQALLLLDHGADPLINQGPDWSHIMLASRYANAEVVQRLLDSGCNPNESKDGILPNLHLSIYPDNSAVLAALIAAGADLESPNLSGETALAYAIRKDEHEAARILLEAGANPDARLKTQRTPLGYSLLNRLNEQALLLLDHGADPLIDQGTTWSHIMLASRYADAEIVQRLLDAGCNPNESKDGILPNLHLAVYQDNSAVLAALIAAGADLNTENTNNQTAMTYAIFRNNIESVRSLLIAGDDPNRVHGRRTILANSLLHHHKEISLLLLEYGAKPFYSSGDDFTHMEMAIQFGDPDVVQRMVDIWHNTPNQQNELVPLLQLAVKSSDPGNLSPLLRALLTDERTTVRHHLENGGDPNAMLNKIPMIIYAAVREDPSLLQLFLDRGVDLIQPDPFTDNPLATTVIGLLSIYGDREIQVNIALHLMDSGLGILPIDRYPAETALLLYYNVHRGFRRDEIIAAAQDKGYSTASFILHGMFERDNIIKRWSTDNKIQYKLYLPDSIPRHGESEVIMVFNTSSIEIGELWYFSKYIPGGRRIPIVNNTAVIPISHYSTYATSAEVYNDQSRVYFVTEEGVYYSSIAYNFTVIPDDQE
ncbi:hypothetical protein JCM12856_02630 [Spirochaeta dissipatitropha]